MSLLDELEESGPQAPIITLVGFPGSGKTSLAGLFPKPIFIQAENSKTVFEKWPADKKPAFLKQLKKADKKTMHRPSKDVMDKLRMLLTEEHDFKTVVFDSVTSLNTLFEGEVVEYDDKGADSIGNAAGGFHKGYDVSMAMHSNIIRACEFIRSKGIAVVFLSHVGVAKMKNRPDEASEYNAYTLGMHDKSRKAYVENSDAVIYIKQEQFVMGGESDKKGNQTKTARVSTTGERFLLTTSDGTVGYIDAKNRYDMPAEIPLAKGTNPLLGYIPFFAQQAAQAEEQQATEEATQEKPQENNEQTTNETEV